MVITKRKGIAIIYTIFTWSWVILDKCQIYKDAHDNFYFREELYRLVNAGLTTNNRLSQSRSLGFLELSLARASRSLSRLRAQKLDLWASLNKQQQKTRLKLHTICFLFNCFGTCANRTKFLSKVKVIILDRECNSFLERFSWGFPPVSVEIAKSDVSNS